MNQHSHVVECSRLPITEEYLYEIKRTNNMRPVIVHLSDAYIYTQAEFAARPAEIGIGDFILVARPEAGIEEAAIQLGNKMSIPVGRISKLMGALRNPHVWKYRAPDERPPRVDLTVSALINAKRWKPR